MSQDIAPAFRTRYDDRHSDIERKRTIADDTTFHRGLGNSGTRVDLFRVPDGCPRCGGGSQSASETEMVGIIDLNPTDADRIDMYCTNPACPHFVADMIERSVRRGHSPIRADTPYVWDNTAECPDCDKRFTVEVKRNSYFHDLAEEGTSCIVETPCDECRVDGAVSVEVDA